jgi:hypothetical protein
MMHAIVSTLLLSGVTLTYWVADGLPDCPRDQLAVIVGDAARHWGAVADVMLVPAASRASAWIVVSAYDDPETLGCSDLGGPSFYAAGRRCSVKLNRRMRATREVRRSNVMHEIGHALGLGHHRAGTVMEPVCNAAMCVPTTEEAAALVALYGPPGGYHLTTPRRPFVAPAKASVPRRASRPVPANEPGAPAVPVGMIPNEPGAPVARGTP